MRRQALATDGPREEVRKPESKKQKAGPQKNAKGVEMTELDGNGVDEIPNLALSHARARLNLDGTGPNLRHQVRSKVRQIQVVSWPSRETSMMNEYQVSLSVLGV